MKIFTTAFHFSNGEFFQIVMSLFKYVEIITHPKDKTVAHGSQVSFTCTSSISSDVTFKWIHNGTFTVRSSTTNTLRIISVSYDDAGSYVCTLSSGSLSVMSNTATLTVYGMFIITWLLYDSKHVTCRHLLRSSHYHNSSHQSDHKDGYECYP